jgi:hypothetical protein
MFSQVIENEYASENLDDFVDDTPNNWAVPTPNGFQFSNGGFVDDFGFGGAGPYSPQPTAPQNPLSTQLIFHDTQGWFVGSLAIAGGVQVQSDQINMYIDHARPVNVVSPVH